MPHEMFARHVATMMHGPHGVDVVVDGVTRRGLFDEDGAIVDDAFGQRVTVPRVLTMSSADPRLPIDQVITVDGRAMVVRTPPLPIEDGGLQRYGLALLNPPDGTV